MTEKELQAAVIDLAHLFGWRVAHFRPAMTQAGNWVTPVQADGKGFPDLVLVRGNRLLFVELKSANGRVSPEQAAWLDDLTGTCADVAIWRPTDWGDGTVEAALR